MPNAQVWGNQGDNQNEEQDLVTKINPDEGDQAIIRVNDVNNNDADRAAIYAKNSNTGASARALYTEGQVEMVAGLTGNPAITTAKVYNPSTDNSALALAVTGRGNIGVQLANDQDDAAKQALNVMGNTHMQSYTGVNAAHKTLHVVNSNANANARALKVEGKTELDMG